MSGHLASWFRRRELDTQADRQIARIAIEVGEPIPDHPNQRTIIPGDPWALRGLPVVGVPGGIGGTITSAQQLHVCWQCGRRPKNCRCRTSGRVR